MDYIANVLRFFGHGLGLPSNFTFVRRLGRGAQGDVWLAVDSKTQTLVAVKIVPRGPPAWRVTMIGREARMMARLGNGHVNVVRPHEIVLTGRAVMSVVEYVRGGSVADFLKKARMDEDLACYLFRQLLDAVGFVHARKIAYRDVKPANCLLTSPGWPPLLKLADFGLSETWDGRDAPVFETLAGTPGYMPPEILGGFFNREARSAYDGVKADVYSCGVMLAVLLMRHLPWEYDAYAARLPPVEAMRALWQLEGVDGVTWRAATSAKRAGKLSESVKDLLDGMLAADDKKRPTLDEVRAHPWVARRLPAEYEAVLATLATRQAAFEAAAPVSDADIAERLTQAEEVTRRAGTVAKGLKAAFSCEMRVKMAPTAPQGGSMLRRDSCAAREAVAAARLRSGELPPPAAPDAPQPRADGEEPAPAAAS